MLLGTLIGAENVLENFLAGGTKEYRTVILKVDENEKLTLPVTPWKYSVYTEQNNKIIDILDFGEILLFGNTKLKKMKVSCFFPATSHEYPFVVGDKKEPSECIDLLTKWKDSGTPVRVIVTDSPVNLMMGINSFDFDEKDGSRDIYFKLDFAEYRDLNTPPANFQRQIDSETGLKTRTSEAISSWIQGNLVEKARDILERSKAAYGDFKHVDTFKTANSFSNLTSFKTSWKW